MMKEGNLQHQEGRPTERAEIWTNRDYTSIQKKILSKLNLIIETKMITVSDIQDNDV